MPKNLSLKKGPQPGASKNQKAITQFFKSNNIHGTQKPQSSPVKSLTSISKKCHKRKATDPDVLDILDDPCEITNVSHTNHTPKKVKSNESCSLRLPVKNSVPKTIKSPQKENTHISPGRIKNESHTLKSHSEKETTVLIQSETNNLILNSVRSPLSPVKNKKIPDNKFIYDYENEISTESCSKDNHNHVIHIEKAKTPKKMLQFESVASTRRSRTPKKSHVQEVVCSPRIKILMTPEKLDQNELSPSKSGSTVKSLVLSQNGVHDMFDDEWDIQDVDEECKENLDLSIIQRCEVTSVTQHPTKLELRLQNESNQIATCLVEGVWLDTPLSVGETMSVLATRDSSDQFYVGNNAGLLALRPDHLMSSTSVVAGVFCKRKAILQERWRGIDSANTAMTIGILIHELVQKALTENIVTIARLRLEIYKIVKDSIQMLYDAGLGEEEALSNMQAYVAPLAEFMQTYVAGNPPRDKQPKKDQWTGHINKVLDIEENLCCPQLGLKGKIDATVEVTSHEQKGRHSTVMPLELKSGRASVSSEHRGQLVLYGMMLSLQRNEDPALSTQKGLLLYLKERVDLREVSCGYPERRDLMMLRNQLVQYLATGPEDVDPEQLTDIEDASATLQQKLPEPVHHQNACAKCPYLTLCSLHLWHTEGPTVSDSHPLSKLREQALGHLSREHIKYFLHWTALLKMEERGQITATPLHTLWTDSVDKRSKRGTCAANLKLKSVVASEDRYLHTLERQMKHIETLQSSKASKGPQEGEFSIVSVDNRPWIAAGVVQLVRDAEISILLERDLGRRFDKDTRYHIDTYESYASTVQNMTNLGVLLEDTDRAHRLRKLIVDRDRARFETKLPREVGRLGIKLMRPLNVDQQRAVLRALQARDYALMRGLPGTGKTQTISVLIQMLVSLKQRVLVTAHTHSAVDTVLIRLPETVRVLRLGTSARVSSRLLDRCEQQLAGKCNTPEQLEQLYDSMEVVGVTCLGANHALLSRTTFDVCIVDEATQVLQSTVLRPLFAANKFLLVGDPDQLPPVVRSRAARRMGMEESLFHRLMDEESTSTLQMQYRMNQALVDVANRVAYNYRLKCADDKVANATLDIDVKKISHLSESSWLLQACSPELENAALFIDLQSLDPSGPEKNKTCTNIEEACVVMAMIEALIVGGVKPQDIGVIAPYRDQVSLLRRALVARDVETSTVDQFQGRDKSVIVYSCTKRDRQDDNRVKDGEILNDQRRLAVSVTRAKHKFLLVGNSRALQRYAPMQKLIDACTNLSLDIPVTEMIVKKYNTLFV